MKPTSVNDIKQSTEVEKVVDSTVEVDTEFDPAVKADISQGQLNTLLQRISALESGSTKPKLEKPKFHTAIVRLIEDKIVVGYGKSWQERGADGEWSLIVEVKYKDGKDIKIKKVEWKKFDENGDKLTAKILKVDQNIRREVKGYTTIKNVDFANYRTVDTGVEVALEADVPEPIYTLEMPDGSQVELTHEAIN